MTGFNAISINKNKNKNTENSSIADVDGILEESSDISVETMTELDDISKAKSKNIFFFYKGSSLA